jgi:hypothetical protein
LAHGEDSISGSVSKPSPFHPSRELASSHFINSSWSYM